MKESTKSNSKDKIFIETFNSADAIKKNGGTATNVTLSNGIASFNGASSVITYGDINKFAGSSDQPFSVIVKGLNANDATTLQRVCGVLSNVSGYEWSISIVSGKIRFHCVSSNNIGLLIGRQANFVTGKADWVFTYTGSATNAGVNIYKNGVDVDNADTSSGTYVKMIPTSAFFMIGAIINSGVNSQFFNGSIESIEVYNRALSAEEVALLYSNSLYKAKVDANAEAELISNTELIVNGGFDTDTGWNKGTGWTISDGKANCVGAGAYLEQTNKVVIGKSYLFSFKISNFSGSGTATGYLGSGAGGVTQFPITDNGSYSYYVSNALNASTGIAFYCAAGRNMSVDDVSVKEVINGGFTAVNRFDFKKNQSAIDEVTKNSLLPNYGTFIYGKKGIISQNILGYLIGVVGFPLKFYDANGNGFIEMIINGNLFGATSRKLFDASSYNIYGWRMFLNTSGSLEVQTFTSGAGTSFVVADAGKKNPVHVIICFENGYLIKVYTNKIISTIRNPINLSGISTSAQYAVFGGAGINGYVQGAISVLGIYKGIITTKQAVQRYNTWKAKGYC